MQHTNQFKTSWVVARAVAKRKPGDRFTASDIADEVGLGPQLVRYHLDILRPRLRKARDGGKVLYVVRKLKAAAR